MVDSPRGGTGFMELGGIKTNNMNRKRIIGLSSFILFFIGMTQGFALSWIAPLAGVVLLTFEDEIFGKN